MRLIDRLLAPFGAQRKGAEAGDGYGVFAGLLAGAMRSKAGEPVSRDTALRVATFFACCRVLMNGAAQVPFKVMQKRASKVSAYAERVDADGHSLYDLLHRQPNDWQTSFEFRETLVLHMLVAKHGAFVFKNWIDVGTGGPRIAELILLDPTRVEPKQAEDWSITYTVRGKDGGVKVLTPREIWHLRGPSWNGLTSIPILEVARDALGLAIATESTHSRMHANGVQPSGVYSIDGSLNEKQREDIVKWLREQAGGERKGDPLILDRGAKWISQVMSGVDAQFLETRRHQIEEVCRFMGVLPIMIGYSDKTTTFASAEAMFLAHQVHTLMPLYERIQQSADVHLLGRADRAQGYYTKLVEHGLLRGDMKSTGEYLRAMVLTGVMDRNYARGLIDLNPLAGLDEPLTPTNMTNDPSGAPAKQEGPTP